MSNPLSISKSVASRQFPRNCQRQTVNQLKFSPIGPSACDMSRSKIYTDIIVNCNSPHQRRSMACHHWTSSGTIYTNRICWRSFLQPGGLQITAYSSVRPAWQHHRLPFDYILRYTTHCLRKC